MTSDSDDLSGHPDLAGVGAAMRSDVGGRATRRDRPTRRSSGSAARRFRDWLTDAMHAGDRLAVTIVDQRFTGTVDEVGDDLLGLRAIFGRVDLHLLPGIPLHIELVDHPTSGGHRGKTDGSFAACARGARSRTPTRRSARCSIPRASTGRSPREATS